MDFFISIAIAISILVIAIYLAMVQIRKYRSIDLDSVDERYQRFLRNQHRRRLQMSVMIGLLGIGFFIGILIPTETYPSLFIAFWAIMSFCVCWVGLLAMLDILSLRYQAGRLAQEYLLKEAQMTAEYQKMRLQAEIKEELQE